MDATGAKPAKWPHSYAEQLGKLASEWLTIYTNIQPEHLDSMMFEAQLFGLAESLSDHDLTEHDREGEANQIYLIMSKAIEPEVEEYLRIDREEEAHQQ